jgi:hypothetical protein
MTKNTDFFNKIYVTDGKVCADLFCLLRNYICYIGTIERIGLRLPHSIEIYSAKSNKKIEKTLSEAISQNHKILIDYVVKVTVKDIKMMTESKYIENMSGHLTSLFDSCRCIMIDGKIFPVPYAYRSWNNYGSEED